MHAAFLTLTAAMLVGQTPTLMPESSGGTVRATRCQVTLIDEIEVSAEAQGVLTDIAIKEGNPIEEGQLLAQIDDQQAQAAVTVAQCKLDAAEAEANNNVEERYAQAAADVALADVEMDYESNRRAHGTTPKAKINHDLLVHKQALLQIEQAKYKQGIARTTVDLREAELDATEVDLEQRKVRSPLAGVVEKLYRRKGEWVQPGQPVMKVLRTDTLWVEGNIDARRYTPGQVRNQPVLVTVNLPGRTEQFEGTIVFASQKLVAGGEFEVKAEVKNRQDPQNGEWLLRSGLAAEMVIQLK